MEVIEDAPNGQKAWELFQEHSPELVITDIVMPEMNGIELARNIKQNFPSNENIIVKLPSRLLFCAGGDEYWCFRISFEKQHFKTTILKNILDALKMKLIMPSIQDLLLLLRTIQGILWMVMWL